MLKRDENLDRVFHALSDCSRRRMLERLSSGPASVSELARPLPMTLAAVVQHVQVLEAAGLVRTKKVGRVRRCELRPARRAPARRPLDLRAPGDVGRRLRPLGRPARRPPGPRPLPRRRGHAMTTRRSVTHTTFVIDRTYAVPPARVFAAFADPELKERWFAMPPDWVDTAPRPRLPGRRPRGNFGGTAGRHGPPVRSPLPGHR